MLWAHSVEPFAAKWYSIESHSYFRLYFHIEQLQGGLWALLIQGIGKAMAKTR